MKIVAGIDPGLDGGVAVLGESDWLETAALPTMGIGKQRVINGAALARWLDERDVTEAIIEEVHSMPKQGVASSFRFGMAFGQLLATLQCGLIPYTLVTPQRWKKHYRLIGKEKDAARRRAIELWPQFAGDFELKKDVHRAEAALIARYGMGA